MSFFFLKIHIFKVQSDVDLETHGDYTIETMVEYNFPSNIGTQSLYSFVKHKHTGYKLNPVGKGLILMARGAINYFSIQTTPVVPPLSYLTLSYHSSTKTVYYYKDGELIGQKDILGRTSNTSLYIGSCSSLCNSFDFKGKVYAFKWTNEFKNENYVKNVWERSKFFKFL